MNRKSFKDFYKSNKWFSVFVGLIGIVLFVKFTANEPLDGEVTLVYSLRFSIPVFTLLSAIFCGYLTKKKRKIGKRLGIFAGILAVSIFSAYAGVIFLNSSFDEGAVTAHETVIVDKIAYKGARQLKVRSWRGNKVEGIEISHESYKRLNQGAKIIIYTKPGAFGFEWIAAIEEVRLNPNVSNGTTSAGKR